MHAPGCLLIFQHFLIFIQENVSVLYIFIQIVPFKYFPSTVVEENAVSCGEIPPNWLCFKYLQETFIVRQNIEELRTEPAATEGEE